jgi:hypothetical protein
MELDEEDPFAETAINPVIRIEDKLLEQLRSQLQAGLLSLSDYNKAAKGAVKVSYSPASDSGNNLFFPSSFSSFLFSFIRF